MRVLDIGGPTALALAIVLGGAQPSLAEPPASRAKGVRLEVRRSRGAESCADEPAIREGVIARLGYDPFTLPVERVVVAAIEGADQGYLATVSLQRPDGRQLGLQQLRYEIASCDELTAAIELAIAVAIDPLTFQAGTTTTSGFVRVEPPPLPPAVVPPPVPPAEPVSGTAGFQATAKQAASAIATPTASPTATTTEAPTESPSEESRLDWRLSAGAGAAFGDTPTTVAAIFAGLELHRSQASIGLEVRGDFAGHQAVQDGSVATSLLLGELVPCYHFGVLGACGLIGAGARNSTGVGLTPNSSKTTAYFALGARVSVDLPIADWFWVRPEVDLLFPTTSITLTASNLAVWDSPPVSAVASIALVVALR